MAETQFPINIENQQRYIAYIIKCNVEEVFHFQSSIITDSSLSCIHSAINELVKNNIPCTIENIASEAGKIDNRIKLNHIKEIVERHTDFSDPKYIRSLIKDNYLKTKYSKEIIEDILASFTSNKELDLQKVKNMSQSLIDEIDILFNKEDDLMTSDILVEKYSEDLKKRSKGTTIRSIGSSVLDKNLKRPAAEGQITTIGALSGGLKSLFCKTLENRLINDGVPVLSINPELNYEQNLDRMVCMRGGIEIDDLMNYDEKNRKLNSSIKRILSILKEKKNFVFSDKESLSLDDIERRIIRTKTILRNNGVFASRNGDEYIFVTIDLLSMIKDFSGANALEIQQGMDKLLEISKRQGVHIVGIIQASETKIRENRGMIRNPDDLDWYKIDIGDIKWGSAWRERSRVMMTLTRPLEMKKLFFPDQFEEWELEKDIINLHCVKQNEGGLFFSQFVFDPENLRISPYRRSKESEE